MEKKIVSVRPYQLMCLVCRTGAEGTTALKNPRLREIVDIIRQDWNTPLMLRCNTIFPFDFQNPGHQEDTPEGELFNVRRDLDILRNLGLVPGSVRPAVDLFTLLWQKIKTSKGICGYEGTNTRDWQGCPDAFSGNYEKGYALGQPFIFAGRSKEELARVKAESGRNIYKLDKLTLRVGHLMCLACFASRDNPPAPIPEDNLFEVLDLIRQKPDIPVHLTDGHCVVCPPCEYYDLKTGFCTGPGRIGSELRAKRKHLVILQKLGLNYDDVLPAAKLLRLTYEKIPSTLEVCGYGDGICTAAEWSICGNPEGNPDYKTGVNVILKILAGK